MARLFADENFNFEVVERLRLLGHDVQTVQEAGEQGASDVQVLAFASAASRAVMTLNRRHFIKLHMSCPLHAGIIVCTDDDPVAMADRIDDVLSKTPVVENQLIRIVRPP